MQLSLRVKLKTSLGTKKKEKYADETFLNQ